LRHWALPTGDQLRAAGGSGASLAMQSSDGRKKRSEACSQMVII
jgi:hypothetical protein